MGIFSKIKDAIFKKKDKPVVAPQVATPAAAAPAPAPQAAAPVAAAPAAPAAPEAIEVVDVAVIMDNLADNFPNKKLNWRQSIVDMMTLLGVDSSLAHRKELATELGYTGDQSDTYTMNIWLHKQVMNELAKNGGIVPEDLK